MQIVSTQGLFEFCTEGRRLDLEKDRAIQPNPTPVAQRIAPRGGENGLLAEIELKTQPERFTGREWNFGQA